MAKKVTYDFDSDSFGTSSVSLAIDEAKEDKIVDGVNILARAVGQFFTVEGKSDNGRFYSKKLWEKAIKDVDGRMVNGTLLGTIGHDQPLDEKALLEGKASHRVSKLWIDENGKGMGEILVLNTPAGRNLNGYLRGGVEFPISSRAYGKFKNSTKQGAQIVDEDTYKLESFDFVRMQGVPGAIPRLVEQQLNDNEEGFDAPDGGSGMDEKILEKLTKDKLATETLLNEAIQANEDVKGQLAVSESKLAEHTETVTTLTTKVEELTEGLKTAQDTVTAYENSGSPTEVGTALDKADEMIDSYVALGSPTALQEKLDELDTITEELDALKESLKDLGSVDEIKKVFDVFEKQASELGNADQIREAFDRTEKFYAQISELGSPDEINKIMDKFEEYSTLGTTDQINKAFDLAEALSTKIKEDRKSLDVKKLSTKHQVEESMAAKLLEKFDADETDAILGDMSEQSGVSITERFKVKKDDDESGDTVSLTEQKVSGMTRSTASRASRLTNNLSK